MKKPKLTLESNQTDDQGTNSDNLEDKDEIEDQTQETQR